PCGMFRNGPRSSAVSSYWLRRSRRSCRPARALLQPPAPPADPTRMATDLRSPSSRIVHPDKDTFLNEENPFEAMMSRFDRAAQLLDLEPGLYKVLRHPEKQIIVSVPVMMGIGELERLTRRYTAGIIHTLGPDSDVPAPDVNTNERVMAWVMDTYSMHHRHTVTAVVTGKPIEMGGSLGRREATGRGCMIVTKEALHHLGMKVAGTTVAVQGFGNVGSVSADLLQKAGFTIVAVSDVKGGIYNAKGLNIPDVLEWRTKNRFL